MDNHPTAHPTTARSATTTARGTEGAARLGPSSIAAPYRGRDPAIGSGPSAQVGRRAGLDRVHVGIAPGPRLPVGSLAGLEPGGELVHHLLGQERGAVGAEVEAIGL